MPILIAMYLESFKWVSFHEQKTLRLSTGTTVDVKGKENYDSSSGVKFEMA